MPALPEGLPEGLELAFIILWLMAAGAVPWLLLCGAVGAWQRWQPATLARFRQSLGVGAWAVLGTLACIALEVQLSGSITVSMWLFVLLGPAFVALAIRNRRTPERWLALLTPVAALPLPILLAVL